MCRSNQTDSLICPRGPEATHRGAADHSRSVTAVTAAAQSGSSLLPSGESAAQNGWRPQYGPHSPFAGEERQTLDAVACALATSQHPFAESARVALADNFSRMEAFGELLARFPSPLARHTLGARDRGLESLTHELCKSSPETFEVLAPTRAVVGRALDIAQLNFFRFLSHVCHDVVPGDEGVELRAATAARVREVMYTKLVEEVLTDLVADTTLPRTTRLRAAGALVQIWEHRLTYRTKEFFPLLDAAWGARTRTSVIGGTLLGTQEMFALFREGCAPEFVEYFVRPEPSEEETEAFREFLFGATSEHLESLSAEMERDEIGGRRLGNGFAISPVVPSVAADPAIRLYAFFRVRSLQAAARRLAGLPGPQRTAEGYVMIDFLARSGPIE